MGEQSGPLSARELEILALVAEGWTNREIARYFWVTENTVKFHLSRIHRKLGVTNRTAAAMWWFRQQSSAPPQGTPV